ncbi:hypothetical protein ACHAWF_017482, partial [Thalassiosira exigua]
VRAIWERGHIPRQLLWVVVVLLPKGRGDYLPGIGLVEPIWKVIEGVIDTRLEIIELHYCLHRYRVKRGTGTATIEAKLAAQREYLEQEPFFLISFDLKKAFNAMDIGRCLRILRGYGVGPKMLRLIKLFYGRGNDVPGGGGGTTTHPLGRVTGSHRVGLCRPSSSTSWWMPSFANGFGYFFGMTLLWGWMRRCCEC